MPLASMADARLDAEDRARLKRVINLSKTGASQLAQALIDAYQPPEQWIESWMLWERQRFVILRNRGDWKAMMEHARAMPENVTPDFRQWVLEQAADASLREGDAGLARSYLRSLLAARRETGKDGKPVKSDADHKKDIARWRRMVIRSYLRDKSISDAAMALDQYIADYNPHGPSWSVLQARVLIMAGKYAKAYETLSGVDRHESRVLQQLAALRGQLVPAAKVVSNTRKLQQRIKKDSHLYLQSNSLLAEAANKDRQDWLRITALEEILQVTSGQSYADGVYEQVDGDMLLNAYRGAAERWGNKKRLLVGDDKVWLKQAGMAVKKKKPVLSRALYALVLLTGTDENRVVALEALLDSLIIDDRDKVIYALFAGGQYKDISVLPSAARFRLAEYALQRRFINMAGRMIEGLEKLPEDNRQGVDWPLRQARILVYSGNQDAAVEKLRQYIISKKSISPEQAEYTSNVIFDLQAVERHKDAISLLELLIRKVKDKESQRRLYFWMADSWKAMQEYARAGELYLRAAYHGQPGGGDHWGQTARFHAAEILARGGMTDDARYIYGSLLRGTKDARRRSMLEQRIEQLWLYQKKQNDIPFLLTPR